MTLIATCEMGFKSVFTIIKMVFLLPWLVVDYISSRCNVSLKNKQCMSNPNFRRTKKSSKHVTIDEEVIRGKKLLFIGDVHGCFDELIQLLSDTKALQNDTVIIFVGDMVNKGPKNMEVLRFLVQHSSRFYAVKGNHELAVLREYERWHHKPNYKLPRKYKWVQCMDALDYSYLKGLPYTLDIPLHNIIVVHAGMVPGKTLLEQKDSDLVKMRNVARTESGYSAKELTNEGLPWALLWKGPRKVIFGHDAVRGLQFHKMAIGLDTGCLYGKHLTGMLLSEDKKMKFFSVKAQHVYVKPDR